MGFGTSVTLTNIIGDNQNGWIKARNMNGLDKILHEGETANNVAKILVAGDNWKMRVTGPAGTTRTLDPGESYVPSKAGDYHVELIDLT